MQAIEDTVTVLQYICKEWQVDPAVPTTVIGGSYGGSLAAYHRVVHPGMFDAAVASSAPVTYVCEYGP